MGKPVVRQAMADAVRVGRISGRGRNATARHSHEWRVLAGFWREKAGAGRVPSFKSGCAAAKMLEGVFSRIIRVA
jgi:hypothetical protein